MMPSNTGIDVGASLREFESALASGCDPDHCRHILGILWRWQRDPDLCSESRAESANLVGRYGSRYLSETSQSIGRSGSGS